MQVIESICTVFPLVPEVSQEFPGQLVILANQADQ